MSSFESICAREVTDPRTTTPHILPLYLTSSYVFESIDQGIRIFDKQESGYLYGRYGNPTVDAIATKIAGLEAYGQDFEAVGMMTGSGMAALHSLLITLLKQGDTIITHGDLYGGTTELLMKIMARNGVTTKVIDLTDIDALDSALGETAARVVFFETPANPTLRCIDIRAVSNCAHAHQAIAIADNTFATPYLQRPFAFGADFIIHSTTKYLNGHGNSIGGMIIGRDAEFTATQVWETVKLTGVTPGPMDAWLVHQGLKTLPLRMDKHCANAMALATYLEAHPKVGSVHYTGLSSHKYHALASEQMHGYGGVLSFEIEGGLEAGINFMRRIRFCTFAPTLGDVDTLILHPASMSHLNVTEEQRRKVGITDRLIRVSVGIESAEDIIEDIERALG